MVIIIIIIIITTHTDTHTHTITHTHTHKHTHTHSHTHKTHAHTYQRGIDYIKINKVYLPKIGVNCVVQLEREKERKRVLENGKYTVKIRYTLSPIT